MNRCGIQDLVNRPKALLATGLLCWAASAGALPVWPAIGIGAQAHPETVINSLPRTPMHRASAAVLPAAGLTYCQARWRRIPIRAATQDGASTPSQRKSETDAGYTHALIVSPADDSAVRGNAGELTVRARVDPPLQRGHRLRLLLDGIAQGVAGRASTFELENIDRGTHSLALQVVDDAGRVLFTGTPSTFHLLRHSRLHRRNGQSN